jgi:hypothetical protein
MKEKLPFLFLIISKYNVERSSSKLSFSVIKMEKNQEFLSIGGLANQKSIPFFNFYFITAVSDLFHVFYTFRETKVIKHFVT